MEKLQVMVLTQIRQMHRSVSKMKTKVFVSKQKVKRFINNLASVDGKLMAITAGKMGIGEPTITDIIVHRIA